MFRSATVTIICILFNEIFTVSSEPEGTCPEPTRCMVITDCDEDANTDDMPSCQTQGEAKTDSPTVCCIRRIELKVVHLTNSTTDYGPPPIITHSTPSETSMNGDHSLFPVDCGLGLDNRIFNGINATLGEQPWMALLGYTMPSLNILQFFCSGSLINNRYVLTAAHCINYEGLTLTAVRLGENNIETDPDCSSNGGVEICADSVLDVPIEKIIIHHGYKKPKRNDIALLRLSQEVEFTDYIQPVCLPFDITVEEEDYVDKVFAIAGWGKLNEDAFMGSSVLQVADVVGWDSTMCNSAIPEYLRPITETELCAEGLQGQDACKGDSGGPLTSITHSNDSPLARHYQIGIVSTGVRCGDNEVPSIYMKVPKYLQWIEENVTP